VAILQDFKDCPKPFESSNSYLVENQRMNLIKKIHDDEQLIDMWMNFLIHNCWITRSIFKRLGSFGKGKVID
jgi:hypothetical protein